MVPKLEGWTIVVVGHWNRMIFAPNWVGKELFGIAEVETLVQLSPLAPTVFRKEDVAVQVDERRLVLAVRQANIKVMNEAERLTCIVLDKLPHTPVSAIGVNFRFAEKNPPDKMVGLFRFADEPEISTRGWDIGPKKVNRSLTGNDGQVLKLDLSYTASEIEISANFHYGVVDASAAAGAIRGKTESLHDSLLSFLTDVYGLTVENATDD